MLKYDEEWNDINTLLSLLTGGHRTAVQLYNEHYLKFHNNAPGLLLEEAIERVQKRLDEAR